MIVYVLFVHKKSVSKRKVCIMLIKNKKIKKTQKDILSGFFRWFFLGFWGWFFLLPTLAPGGAQPAGPPRHPGERLPRRRQRRPQLLGHPLAPLSLQLR
jgi:hypothetical protein